MYCSRKNLMAVPPEQLVGTDYKSDLPLVAIVGHSWPHEGVFMAFYV